ncbi:MAG: hypothetical protein AAF563_13650 [Pseudomonadota bacterium]
MVTKFQNIVAALAVTTAMGVLAAPAGAQMFERAYSNSNRDGLSSAVVMKQVDEGLFSPQQPVVSSGGGGGDVLLCGSDESQSSATANSSCIIIGDGATAIIDMGQDSLGDQDANAESNQDVNGDLSDALEALSGG